MTASGPATSLRGAWHRPWLFVALGWALLYLPTYVWAARTIWQSEDHAHGALVLAVCVWLLWRQRERIATAPVATDPSWGWPLFALGLVCLITGRAFQISILELFSQIPVGAGLLLLLRGRAGLRALWFPLVFLIFMVPLPGVLVDALTASLKDGVSSAAADLLYLAGYPIARAGVTLSVGPYQLLVADACSGMNSLVSLSAIGVLYLYLSERASVAHNAVMLAAIVPIALASNLVRVIALVLVTYHWGDAAGQGFLHNAAGLLLMGVALLLLFALDFALARWLRRAPG